MAPPPASEGTRPPQAAETGGGVAGETNGLSEAASLEVLKTRVNDPSFPTLDLARALQAHLNAHPQSQKDLSEKLGVPQKRAYLSQVLALLKLPSDVQGSISGQVLSGREMWHLSLNSGNKPENRVKTPGTLDENTENTFENTVNKRENRPQTPLSQGYPLLRDTINTIARLVFFWARDSKLGELAEQWAVRFQLTGGSRVVGIVLLWGLAGYGGWILLQNVERGMRNAGVGKLPFFNKGLPSSASRAPSSAPVEFDTQPVNDKDRVEPLPLAGTVAPAAPGSMFQALGNTRMRLPGASSQQPRAPLAPPSEVHADVRTPDLIRLSWRAVAKDVRYNVYSSASRTLTALRKENENPLKSNTVDWTPETGLERYWVVVTSLDAQGRESVYSEAIEVVRHPDKSGRSGAEEAAGVLRKVLPW